MDEIEVASVLKRIGLTEGEVRVYLALLELGSSTTGPIIEQSGITSSKVYLILERLGQKGLVSQILKNNVKWFQIADPNRILEYLHDRMSELRFDEAKVKEVLPVLRARKNLLTHEQETSMFEGPRGLRSARLEFISDMKAGDEYLVFGSEELDEKAARTIRSIHADNEERGIRTRLIYRMEKAQAQRLFKRYPLTKVRIVKDILPSSVAITEDKVLLMAHGERPIQVLIKARPIARSYNMFFESIWENATPLK